VLHPQSDEAMRAMLDGMTCFGMGYSWGGFESLILRSSPSRYRTATRWPWAGPLLRIHAGLEDPDDMIADLEAGFARLRAATLTHMEA
jgi:cystathionine beta-lyase